MVRPLHNLHNQHRTGNLFEVHIILSVPGHGRDLAVSRPLQRAQERFANPDIHVSICDTFDAAERQLEAFKGRVRSDIMPPGASALTGCVSPPG